MTNKPDANGSFSVTDSEGRALVFKKLSLSEEMNLAKMAGPDGESSKIYMAVASFAARLVSINGDLVPFPTTRIKLEQKVDNDLKDSGMKAATEYFNALGIELDVDDAKEIAEQDVAAAKKS